MKKIGIGIIGLLILSIVLVPYNAEEQLGYGNVTEVEPNDSKDSAMRVYPGDIVFGNLGNGDMDDWYKIFLQEEETLVLILETDWWTDFDLSLYYYDDMEERLVLYLWSSHILGYTEKIKATTESINATGFYYINVDTWSSLYSGSYKLIIKGGYTLSYYSPDVGYFAKIEEYDADEVLNSASELSSYKYSGNKGTEVPNPSVGDYWDFNDLSYNASASTGEGSASVSMSSTLKYEVKEKLQDSYNVKISGKVTTDSSVEGAGTNVETTFDGNYFWNIANYAVIKEDLTTVMNMSMSSGRSTGDDWPDGDIPGGAGTMMMSTYAHTITEYNPNNEIIKFPIKADEKWDITMTLKLTVDATIKMTMDGQVLNEQKMGPATISDKICYYYQVVKKSSVSVKAGTFDTYVIKSMIGRPPKDTPSPDFSLKLNVPSTIPQIIAAGKKGYFEVSLESLNKFSSDVTLTATSSKSGLSLSFEPSKVSPPGNSTLIVSVDKSAIEGNYKVTVKGSGGGKEHTAIIQLTIVGTDFGILSAPLKQVLPLGSAGTAFYEIAIVDKNGFEEEVSLKVEVTPKEDSISVSFEPEELEVNEISTMKVSIKENTPKGRYTINVSGEGGGKKHSVSVTLEVCGDPTYILYVSDTLLLIEPGTKESVDISIKAIGGFNKDVNIDVIYPKIIEDFGVKLSVGKFVLKSPKDSTELTIEVPSSIEELDFTLSVESWSGLLYAGLPIAVSSKKGITEGPQPEEGFTIDIEPITTITIAPGAESIFTLVSDPIENFTGKIELKTKYPTDKNLNVKLSSQSIEAGDTAQITITSSSTTPIGTYEIEIEATSGNITYTKKITIIFAEIPDFSIKLDKSIIDLEIEKSSTVKVSFISLYKFNETIKLEVVSNISGLEVTVDKTTVSPDGSIVLTAKATGKVKPGEYVVNVKCTSGNITHTVPVKVKVSGKAEKKPAAMAISPIMIGGIIGVVIIVVIAVVGIVMMKRRQKAPPYMPYQYPPQYQQPMPPQQQYQQPMQPPKQPVQPPYQPPQQYQYQNNQQLPIQQSQSQQYSLFPCSRCGQPLQFLGNGWYCYTCKAFR
ncbi:MAG: hypothetical protein AB1779_04160 [Candidatus Thermoplasmatota archaeon]